MSDVTQSPTLPGMEPVPAVRPPAPQYPGFNIPFDQIVAPRPTTPVDPVASTPAPAYTPNVVVQNPTVRRVVNVILGIGGTLTACAWVVDAALPQVNWEAYTTPASAILVGIAGVFNLAVTVPNIPTK